MHNESTGAIGQGDGGARLRPSRLGVDDVVVRDQARPIQPSSVVVEGGEAPLNWRSRRRPMARCLIFLRRSWAFNELVRAMTRLRQGNRGAIYLPTISGISLVVHSAEQGPHGEEKVARSRDWIPARVGGVVSARSRLKFPPRTKRAGRPAGTSGARWNSRPGPGTGSGRGARRRPGSRVARTGSCSSDSPCPRE